MKRVLMRKSVAIVSKMLVATAVAFVSMASVWYFHRPNTPAELKAKQ